MSSLKDFACVAVAGRPVALTHSQFRAIEGLSRPRRSRMGEYRAARNRTMLALQRLGLADRVPSPMHFRTYSPMQWALTDFGLGWWRAHRKRMRARRVGQ